MTHGLHLEPKKSKPAPAKKDALEKAFDRADELGWIPYFRDAAEANDFTPELLMGIGYRETRLDPKYLKEAGDHGHGYGLMQIDNRYFSAWVNTGAWKKAKEGIDKGAEVLASTRDEIQSSVGKKVKATHAGKTFEFEGKPIAGADLLRVAVAGYNSGLIAYYYFCEGRNVDEGTTQQDYSKDVLAKTARFKPLLEPKPGDYPTAPTTPKGSRFA